MQDPPVKLDAPWQRFDTEREFSDFMEALLKREHADADCVWSPDDSGGDGGRDCVVEYPDRRLIYQFKFYKDGLTSKPDSRKRQIKKSFIAAAKYNPNTWILIFPSHINDHMLNYIKGLPKDKHVLQKAPDAGSISVEYRDVSDLNSILARHNDLKNILYRDELLGKAAILNQERAVLSRPMTDLASRARSLNDLADDIDPDWGVDHGVHNGVAYISPRAKHPHAKPISIDLGFNGPSDNPDLAKMAKAIRFGAKIDAVDLPGEFVQVTGYKGPEMFRPQGQLAGLRMIPVEDASRLSGEPLRLTLTDDHGLFAVRGDDPVVTGIHATVFAALVSRIRVR